jgi:hypothetical protein
MGHLVEVPRTVTPSGMEQEADGLVVVDSAHGANPDIDRQRVERMNPPRQRERDRTARQTPAPTVSFKRTHRTDGQTPTRASA